MKNLDTFIAQCVTFINGSLSPNRTFRCLVVVNFSGLLGEALSDIFAVIDDGLDQLPIKGHGLNADRHQCRAAPGFFRSAWIACFLDGVRRDCYGRRNTAHLVAVALRATDQLALELAVEVIGTAKPAFKFVVVDAAEVVNDHVFSRGAGTGIV